MTEYADIVTENAPERGWREWLIIETTEDGIRFQRDYQYTKTENRGESERGTLLSLSFAAKHLDAVIDALVRIREASKGTPATSRCLSQSHDDPNDEDDPPVTCTRESGHRGKHAGGTRGGTLEWEKTK